MFVQLQHWFLKFTFPSFHRMSRKHSMKHRIVDSNLLNNRAKFGAEISTHFWEVAVFMSKYFYSRIQVLHCWTSLLYTVIPRLDGKCVVSCLLMTAEWRPIVAELSSGMSARCTAGPAVSPPRQWIATIWFGIDIAHVSQPLADVLCLLKHFLLCDEQFMTEYLVKIVILITNRKVLADSRLLKWTIAGREEGARGSTVPELPEKSDVWDGYTKRVKPTK